MNLLNLLTLLTIDKFEIILLFTVFFSPGENVWKEFSSFWNATNDDCLWKNIPWNDISFLQVGVTLFYVVMEFLWGLIVDN